MHDFIESIPPTVLAALISGFVALLVSATSGVYTILKSRRELEEHKRRLISGVFSRSAAEAFFSELSDYQERYHEHKEIMEGLSQNPDGTAYIQSAIDFYAEYAKPLVEKYPDFVPSNVTEAHSEINKIVEKLEIHSRPNNQSSLNLVHELLRAWDKATSSLAEFKPR